MTQEERCAGTRLAKQVLDVIREDYNALTKEGRLSFATALRERFFPTPEPVEEIIQPRNHLIANALDVVKALEQCEEMLDLCGDAPGECMEALEFCESVEEKVRGIQATIEKTQRVTDRQQTALNNMHRGLGNWFVD